jgi:hypothetical protein
VNHLPNIAAREHSVHRDIKTVPHGSFRDSSPSRA